MAKEIDHLSFLVCSGAIPRQQHVLPVKQFFRQILISENTSVKLNLDIYRARLEDCIYASSDDEQSKVLSVEEKGHTRSSCGRAINAKKIRATHH